ncbi:hypothetical protein HY772_02560 [Candidatus Woesearchaeota archaeon]|nr:hypothetical protein [Candidatus Woesearchaeota archaeon]
MKNIELREDDIGLRFHYLFDGSKNCYLIGARLIGNTKPVKDILDNKEVWIGLELLVEDKDVASLGPWLDMGYICFVPAGTPNVYHTEKLFEIQHTESDNSFSKLRVTLYSRNALIARYSLSHVIEK